MTAHGRCARGGVPLRKMARDLSRSQRAREKKSPTRAAFDRRILNNHTRLSFFVYTKKIWRRIVCVLWLDCAANCGCPKIIFFGRIAKKTGATCNGNVCHQFRNWKNTSHKVFCLHFLKLPPILTDPPLFPGWLRAAAFHLAFHLPTVPFQSIGARP